MKISDLLGIGKDAEAGSKTRPGDEHHHKRTAANSTAELRSQRKRRHSGSGDVTSGSLQRRSEAGGMVFLSSAASPRGHLEMTVGQGQGQALLRTD